MKVTCPQIKLYTALNADVTNRSDKQRWIEAISPSKKADDGEQIYEDWGKIFSFNEKNHNTFSTLQLLSRMRLAIFFLHQTVHKCSVFTRTLANKRTNFLLKRLMS